MTQAAVGAKPAAPATFDEAVVEIARLALEYGAWVDDAHLRRLLATAEPERHLAQVLAAWEELDNA